MAKVKRTNLRQQRYLVVERVVVEERMVKEEKCEKVV
jgi:hypothetical protein